MVLTSRSEAISDGHAIRFVIELDSSPLSYAQAMRRWREDEEFRSLFIALLANAPFAAFRWETPPITAATATRPFEFVVLNSPDLAGTASADAFARHFDPAAMRRGVVEFANLGKDAILVVPCPSGSLHTYGHLAAFVREAPEKQRHDLWELVGEAAERRLGAKPVWISTAGAGVPWLHVRLDDQPKYYRHGPYREHP